MSEVKQADFSEDNPYQAEGQKKSSVNCCLLGCLGTAILLVLLVVGVTATGYWWFKGQVNKYTAESPADLPTVELSAEQLAEVEGRIKTFKDSVEAGETPEDLVLTAEEINGLLAKNEEMKGKVYVRIEDGLVTGDVSIPTDGIPGGAGRFFNASATFDVSLENGVLIVTLDDAKVKGEPIPEQFIDAMKQENLAKEAYNDPEVAKMLRGFDSISVEGDKIILKPRPIEPKSDSAEDETTSEAAAEGVDAVTEDPAVDQENATDPPTGDSPEA